MGYIRTRLRLAMPMEKVTEKLAECGEVVNSCFEDSNSIDNCKSLVRVITLQNCDKEDFPHLITVSVANEEFQLLVTVAGRRPMCLKCKKVGHVQGKGQVENRKVRNPGRKDSASE